MAKGKMFVGKVVSTKNTKTVIVAILSTSRHPLYKKAVRSEKRLAAHNESLQLTVGDRVQIAQHKPISKTKHFIVVGKVA